MRDQERENMKLGQWGGWENLGEVREKKKSIIKRHCIKPFS